MSDPFERLRDTPGVAAGDIESIRSAATGEGLLPLTREVWNELAEAARKTMATFQEMTAGMTAEQAAYVRRLRCVEDYSWRAVADTCHLEWGGEWTPPDNQLMGMALCERAASFTGEDYMKEPWN